MTSVLSDAIMTPLWMIVPVHKYELDVPCFPIYDNLDDALGSAFFRSNQNTECIYHVWDIMENKHVATFYKGQRVRKVEAKYDWLNIYPEQTQEDNHVHHV